MISCFSFEQLEIWHKIRKQNIQIENCLNGTKNPHLKDGNRDK